jgi:hypothetical protein
MIFTKIKHSKGQVSLSWSDNNDAGTSITHEMTSGDEPRKEFGVALQNLADVVLKVCELPPTYRDGLTVSSVSFTENDAQGLGLVITALKEVGGATAPFVINTPHVVESLEAANRWPTGTDALVEALEEEAARFRRGDRAQADLFESDGSDDEEDL